MATQKKTSKKKRTVGEAQKQAMAEGRTQSKIVREYLAALEAQKDGRGRKPRRPEEIQKEIEREPDPIKRLELVQKRMEAQERYGRSEDEPDLEVLEARFLEVVVPYAERRGVAYMAFRELGVPAAVLKKAGIPRKHRPK